MGNPNQPFQRHTLRLLERLLFSADLARAARSSVAMLIAWTLAIATGHADAVVLVAPAAQNVAMPDVRGDYRMRLGMLATLTAVASGSAFVGVLAAHSVVAATCGMAVLAILAGVYRHLSGEYGAHFAVTSALIFLIALSQPGDLRVAESLAAATALAGVVGLAVQLVSWLVAPQQALRREVSEAWLAVADYAAALAEEPCFDASRRTKIAQQEGAVRTTVDRTLRVLQAAKGARNRDLVDHLDAATQLAARLATRLAAFHTAIEAAACGEEFGQTETSLEAAYRSLSLVGRAAGLAIFTFRAEHVIALSAQMRRADALIEMLDARLATDPSWQQSRHILEQVRSLLPAITEILDDSVGHGVGEESAVFRLPDLSDRSLLPLRSWIDPPPTVDSELVRYTLRITVLLIAAIAVYKSFDIPHGYWLALTALVVLQPNYGDTRRKAGERLVGTLAGGVAGSVFVFARLPLHVIVVSASAMAFLFAYYVRRRYALAVFFVTIMIVIMTEAFVPVRAEFIEARLLSTLVGGVVAVLAAYLFWPKWERTRFPALAAAGVRANGRYLSEVAEQLRRQGRFTGSVVEAKRDAERANSLLLTSLNRLLNEPGTEQHEAGRAAALMNYSQRLTRSITVLGQHLHRPDPVGDPEFAQAAATITASLETLAGKIETGSAAAPLASPVQIAPAHADASHSLAATQLANVATEVEALRLTVLGNGAGAD